MELTEATEKPEGVGSSEGGNSILRLCPIPWEPGFGDRAEEVLPGSRPGLGEAHREAAARGACSSAPGTPPDRLLSRPVSPRAPCAGGPAPRLTSGGMRHVLKTLEFWPRFKVSAS